MGNINLLAVILAAATFFVVGSIWYGIFFGKTWQKELGLSDADLKGGNMAKIYGLTFLLELVMCLMLGHNIARTSPPPHVIMMMATGFGATIIAPAIGINYLFQRRSLKLFAIDSGHFIIGLMAAGGVFILFAQGQNPV
ncbi:MAG: DUF1761 domain-containing protein [Sphingomonadaceae bacterium]